MEKSEDLNLIAFNVSKVMNWSVPFGRLYSMYRLYSGLSHLEAFDKSLASPIISEMDKPTSQDFSINDLFEKEFS